MGMRMLVSSSSDSAMYFMSSLELDIWSCSFSGSMFDWLDLAGDFGGVTSMGGVRACNFSLVATATGATATPVVGVGCGLGRRLPP